MTEESKASPDKPIGNDSVPSLSHDQPPKEKSSPAVTKKPDAQQEVKFSNRIVQYPNQELKLFEDDNVVGCGIYGRVRKYHHKDKTVAIKEFSITGDDETVSNIWNMVQHEANILCRFHHENIVEILGITQWPNVVGIIMEYIDGGNLQMLLSEDNQSKMSWNTRLDIANGITSGLEYIHNYDETKTFCHGDLKPANVLLTQSLQVKLVDFGSAAFHRATAALTTTIQQSSTTQFTLVYVAPEFLQDNTQKRNPTMDMYSFGLLLYELISRRAPYSDTAMPMYVPALIMANVKPSDKLIDDAESQLEADDDRAAFSFLKKLMQRCWNNDPGSRPSSKTVKMELSSISINQSQGFNRRIYGSHDAGAETAATDRDTASARKAITQSLKSSTSAASEHPFLFGEETSLPKPTSTGKSSLEEIFGTLGNDLFRSASRLDKPLESLINASGSSGFIGNQKSIQDLLAKYTDCLLSFNFEQADWFRAALRSLIADDVDAEAKNVMLFAEKLKSEKKYLPSVAVFDTAVAMYARMKNPEEDLETIRSCIEHTRVTIKQMVNDDAKMKVIVREHVLPLMRDWLREMKNTSLSQVSEKWRCHAVCSALHNIDLSETVVDQWEESKQTLEEAVSEMRRVFGPDVYKQHGLLFGTLLNNLGVDYKRESRFEEATALFEESIKAHQAGVDYFGDEEDRRRDIEISEENVHDVSKKLWKQKLQMK